VHFCFECTIKRLSSVTTFSNGEHADIMYVFGFCDSNEQVAVEGHRQLFPDRGVPDRRVFSSVYQSIGQTGAVPQRKCGRPQRRRVAQMEDDILDMVQSSTTANIRRIANRIGTSQTAEWRTAHDFVLYPFHIQNVQAL
jgi:hypothetical protein